MNTLEGTFHKTVFLSVLEKSNQLVEPCEKPGILSPLIRALDVVFAGLLIILTAPVMLAAALLIRWTSRGPAFYPQIRLGFEGRPFTIYKIRTMRHECEKQSGVRWCMPGDSRITRVGRVLRATKIDELPQFWNVLRGEMSLVGPRPERPEFVPHLKAAIPRYHERLLVLPGVSGLAQVHLPADTDLESVRRKLSCDLYYINNMSVWLYTRILLATPLHVFRVPVAVTRALLALPGLEMMEEIGELRGDAKMATADRDNHA